MSITILVAEHDQGLRQALQRCLLHHGHDVVAVSDGIQCVDHLRRMSPALLVLDPHILWGGGDGVLEWLMQEEPIRPPIIAVVEAPESPGFPATLESGVSARIQRPRDLSDLLPFIHEIERLLVYPSSIQPSTGFARGR